MKIMEDIWHHSALGVLSIWAKWMVILLFAVIVSILFYMLVTLLLYGQNIHIHYGY